jgi:hypothetical protein
MALSSFPAPRHARLCRGRHVRAYHQRDQGFFVHAGAARCWRWCFGQHPAAPLNLLQITYENELLKLELQYLNSNLNHTNETRKESSNMNRKQAAQTRSSSIHAPGWWYFLFGSTDLISDNYGWS